MRLHDTAGNRLYLNAEGRAAFLAGMVASPLIMLGVTGQLPEITVPSSPLLLVIGGFLTGIGTTYGSGCTSGQQLRDHSDTTTRRIDNIQGGY